MSGKSSEELQLTETRRFLCSTCMPTFRTVPHLGFSFLDLTKLLHPRRQHTAERSHWTHLGVRPVHFSVQCWFEFSDNCTYFRAGFQNCLEEAELLHKALPSKVFDAEKRSWLCYSFPVASHIQYAGWESSGEAVSQHHADMLLRQEYSRN